MFSIAQNVASGYPYPILLSGMMVFFILPRFFRATLLGACFAAYFATYTAFHTEWSESERIEALLRSIGVTFKRHCSASQTLFDGLRSSSSLSFPTSSDDHRAVMIDTCESLDEMTMTKVVLFVAAFVSFFSLFMLRTWRVKCVSVLFAIAVVYLTFDENAFTAWIAQNVDIGAWLSNIVSTTHADMVRQVGAIIQNVVLDKCMTSVAVGVRLVYFLIIATHVHVILRA